MRRLVALVCAWCFLQGCGKAAKPHVLEQETPKFAMEAGARCKESDGCTIVPIPGKWMLRQRSLQTENLPHADVARGKERAYCVSLESRGKDPSVDWGADTSDYDIRLEFLVSDKKVKARSNLINLKSIEGHDHFIFAKLGLEFAGGRKPKARRVQFRPHTRYYEDKTWLPEADGTFSSLNEMAGFSLAASGDQMTGFSHWSVKAKGGVPTGGIDRIVLARVGDGKWAPEECDVSYFESGPYINKVHSEGIELRVEEAGRQSMKGGFQYGPKPRKPPLTELVAQAAARVEAQQRPGRSRSEEEIVKVLLQSLATLERSGAEIPRTKITPVQDKPVALPANSPDEQTQVEQAGEDLDAKVEELEAATEQQAALEVSSDGAVDGRDFDADDEPDTRFARGAPDQDTLFYRN